MESKNMSCEKQQKQKLYQIETNFQAYEYAIHIPNKNIMKMSVNIRNFCNALSIESEKKHLKMH